MSSAIVDPNEVSPKSTPVMPHKPLSYAVKGKGPVLYLSTGLEETAIYATQLVVGLKALTIGAEQEEALDSMDGLVQESEEGKAGVALPAQRQQHS